MKLILFDIDGTIVDSIATDDACFIQTFKEVHQVDLTHVDWNTFKNVTDTGLTLEIFETWFNRLPTKEEITTLKAHFYTLLQQRTEELTEIEHAVAFIQQLSVDPTIDIGFATGGWRETAELKCSSIGLHLDDFIVTSANDHHNRRKITELAIEKASNGNRTYESIVYFGDGLWDLKTTAALGIDFIGVDAKGNNVLRNAGAKKIIRNYADPDRLMHWINTKTPA